LDDNLLKSSYGTVRPYTRHVASCTRQQDHNACRCPKWLYVFTQATREKRRYTLNTPSWAEALREADDALRGLDPEIAASRAKVENTSARMTVREAMHLWVTRSENKLGKDSTTIAQYRHLEELVSEWARANGIKYAKDITSHQLESWYASEEWTSLAPTTRKQRWAVLRVMFAHMVKMKAISESPADPIETASVTTDQVQGPYSDAQVKAILNHIEYVPNTVTDKTGYVTRLRAFVRLLLDSGCDVSDALQFGPHQLEKMRISKRDVWVFRYKRQKTKQLAVIPITAELVNMLLHLPLEPGVSKDAPFRIKGISLKAAQNRWSRRVQYAISAAEVTHIDLPDGRKKDANVKQFRHTAVVRWLRNGQRVEEVAKMLGHSNAEMVRRHYAPWLRDMDVAHVSRVVSQWR
jgi:integrase